MADTPQKTIAELLARATDIIDNGAPTTSEHELDTIARELEVIADEARDAYRYIDEWQEANQ